MPSHPPTPEEWRGVFTMRISSPISQRGVLEGQIACITCYKIKVVAEVVSDE